MGSAPTHRWLVNTSNNSQAHLHGLSTYTQVNGEYKQQQANICPLFLLQGVMKIHIFLSSHDENQERFFDHIKEILCKLSTKDELVKIW